MNPGPLLAAKVGPRGPYLKTHAELDGNPLLAAEIRSCVHARFA